MSATNPLSSFAIGDLPPAAAPAEAAEPARPGYTGMRVGITAEFAVFFVVYFVARWSYPDVFREGAPKLWTLGGILITVVMLTNGDGVAGIALSLLLFQ